MPLDLDHDLYEYELGLRSNIIVAGRLKTHIQFWNSFGACQSVYVIRVIDSGFRIPFYSTPSVSFSAVGTLIVPVWLSSSSGSGPLTIPLLRASLRSLMLLGFLIC